MKVDVKFLKEVLAALDLIRPADLPGESCSASIEVIARAAKWALNDPDYKLEEYTATPLRPVLASIQDEQSSAWLRPQALSLGAGFFPQKTKPSNDELNAQLLRLKQSLSSKDHTVGGLMATLEYHGSTLGVNEHHADIPMFDFVKVTSALVHCLVNGDGRVVLLGGNLSGIQSYLYEIISKRASKLLKGRSFYLHLLSDSLASLAVDRFDVTPYHVIYNSGGGFYILLPHRENLFPELDDFKNEVTKQLFDVHGANLYYDVEWTEPLSDDKAIDEVWKELLLKLNTAKYKRLSHNPDLLKKLLEIPVEEGGEAIRDAITNEEIGEHDKVNIGTSEQPVYVSTFTRDQIEKLGRRLRDAKYWISTDIGFNGSIAKKSFKDPFDRWHLLTSKHPKELSLPADAIIRVFNDPQEDFPFTFYGGNDVPIFDKYSWERYEGKDEFEIGGPKPFDCLAEGERLDRLGILRMDVDNLGAIFSGLGNQASYVRYAALSRALDWFFKGYLNTIRNCDDNYRNSTIIIYSGGDDLFIVGRWLEVFHFANDIAQGFENWTCNKLTLSGGMVIVPPKFPVMQAAKLAGTAEERAKEYPHSKKPEKNAFVFLGKAMGWKREIPILRELHKTFNDLKVENDLLRRINVHAIAREEQESKDLPKRWIWRLIYDFERYKARISGEEKSKMEAFIDEIKTSAVTGRFSNASNSSNMHALELLHIVSRFVELENRTIKS